MRGRYKEGFLRFCFANCITFGGLINIMLLYIGIGFVSESIRRLLFIGFIVAFMIISICIFLIKRRELKLSFKTHLVLFIFIAYYAYGIIYSLIEFGITSTWKEYVPQLVVMGVPGLLFGLIGAKGNMVRDFLPYLEKGSLIALPIAGYYAVVHWFGIANMEWDYGKAVGPLGYMYLANIFMPYMLAHMLSFLFDSERKIEWFNCRIAFSQFFRVLFIGVYWIAILASGTRGIMISSVFSMIIMVIVKLFRRSGIRQIWLPLSVIFVAVFLGLVWSPKGMSEGGIHRWSAVIEGLKSGKLATNREEVFESDEQFQGFIDDKDSELIKDNKTGESGDSNNNISEESDSKDSDKEASEKQEDSNSINNKIDVSQFAREDLFKIAIEEFKRHPIVGIGPMAYSIKYGAAPHAIALEVLCETGIVGAVIYVGCIVYVLVMWIFRRKKSESEVILLCFLATYIVKLNVSGYLWRDPEVILFAMAIGATLIDSYAKE